MFTFNANHSSRRQWLGGCASLLAIGAGWPQLVQAQTRELKVLSGFAPNIAFSRDIIRVYLDNVQKASAGQMTSRLNGPEVVPFADQFQPVAAGAFDLLFTHPAYHSGTTAIGLSMDAIAPNPAKRRSSGVFDFVDKHYNKLGLKVIAITPTGTKGFQFVTKQPIKGPQGLQGMKIRATVSYHPMIKALGGTPVVMGAGEVYSALEKGVIDAAAWGLTGVADFKWNEVAKYLARPVFGQASLFALMNLRAWNALTPAQQKLLTDEAIKLESSVVKRFDELAAEELTELKRRGMQETQFASVDADRLEALWAQGVWEVARAKNGAAADELRAIAQKADLTK
ncbi:TRAP transporter substrate-binding protein DctP [Rhodoferax sp.]|uniref:TRAP transporter substrate-binding protein DctP n=1 Tax=Rhodoferax sp. TaxID=50421 RepID=UPI00261273B8|nr:TRAP transporter substrate-binding protein DctP [Rhodoferax sp.]MDD2925402.1 TRAP transporter substrate-binding protein DctP [Rhodoferax sp.]